MKNNHSFFLYVLLITFFWGTVLSACNKKSETGTPVVTTIAPTSVTNSTALTGGIIVNKGNSAVSACGVCYGVSQSPSTSGTTLTSSVDSGSFVSSLTGLTGGTTYYVRAYATNGQGTSYGTQYSFITPTFTAHLGVSYGGGIIAYVDSTGQHGLIIAGQDLGFYSWTNSSITTGATSVSDGKSNTAAIIAAMGSNAGSYAALACSLYRGGGYSDWYLPSKNELDYISKDQQAAYNYQQDFYWSSTEGSASTAVAQEFQEYGAYIAYDYTKTTGYYVRPVRSF